MARVRRVLVHLTIVVYRVLVLLYPPGLRRMFGSDMIEAVHARLEGAEAPPLSEGVDAPELIRAWRWIIRDLVHSAPAAWSSAGRSLVIRNLPVAGSLRANLVLTVLLLTGGTLAACLTEGICTQLRPERDFSHPGNLYVLSGRSGKAERWLDRRGIKQIATAAGAQTWAAYRPIRLILGPRPRDWVEGIEADFSFFDLLRSPPRPTAEEDRARPHAGALYVAQSTWRSLALGEDDPTFEVPETGERLSLSGLMEEPINLPDVSAGFLILRAPSALDSAVAGIVRMETTPDTASFPNASIRPLSTALREPILWATYAAASFAGLVTLVTLILLAQEAVAWRPIRRAPLFLIVTLAAGIALSSLALSALGRIAPASLLEFGRPSLTVRGATACLLGMLIVMTFSRPVGHSFQRAGSGSWWIRTLGATSTGSAAVLLALAFMNVQAAIGLGDYDPGFRLDGVWSIRMRVPSPFITPGGLAAMDSVLQGRVAEIVPGASAALTNLAPFSREGNTNSDLQILGSGLQRGRRESTVNWRAIGPGYWDVLEIQGMKPPMARPGEVIVNRSMAARFWADTKAIGEQVEIFGRIGTVAGEAPDIQHFDPEDDSYPMLYLPLLSVESPEYVDMLIRFPDGIGASMPGRVFGEIRQLYPDSRPIRVDTLRELLQARTDEHLPLARLFTVLGLVCLLLFPTCMLWRDSPGARILRNKWPGRRARHG